MPNDKMLDKNLLAKNKPLTEITAQLGMKLNIDYLIYGIIHTHPENFRLKQIDLV